MKFKTHIFVMHTTHITTPQQGKETYCPFALRGREGEESIVNLV